MNIERTFEHLERRIQGYVGAAQNGQKNPKLVAQLFGDCDALVRDTEDDPQLAQSARAFVNAAEDLIRLCGRPGFDAARRLQAENAAELRSIIANKVPSD